MNKRGAVGIAALWILVAAAALAVSVATVARAQASRSQLRLDEARLMNLVVTAVLLERDAGFVTADHLYSFRHGQIQSHRSFEDGKKNVHWICRAQVGSLKKNVEIGWVRRGDVWLADYWSEPL